MIQPTNNLNPLSAVDPRSPKATKGGLTAEGANGEDAGFQANLENRLGKSSGSDAAQANLVAMMAGQAAPAVTPKLSQEALQKGMERPSQPMSARMDLADYAPLTARVAGSVNAASSVTGLKPWNQDWVFEGNPKPMTEDVKPLFGPSEREAQLAQLQEALKAMGFAAAAGVPGAGNNPQAQTAMIDGLQKRSDQDSANLAPQTGAVAGQANPADRMQMAQVAGVLAGNLNQQLKSMNGEMTEVGDAAPQGAAKKLPAGAQLMNGSGMTGAEFMSALQRVRTDHAAGVNPAQEGGQGGDSMQQQFSQGAKPELKVIDGAKSSKDSSQEFVMSSAPSSLSAMHSQQSSSPAQAPVVQVTGHVVPGAMAQDQLSHEALLGVSAGIRNLSTQGGGEMRIRLRPENLGELHLKVVTQGNDVGLQIQATDEKAKKILQDSLGSLKDGLAQQNLTLGKVEFSVAQASSGHGSNNDSHSNQQQSSSQQQSFQSALGQNNGGNRNQGQTQWNGPENEAVAARPLKSATSANGSNANARVANGRLDVMA